MPWNFFESTKGQPMLIFSSYLFREGYVNPIETSWRCASNGCKARIQTRDGAHRDPPEHSHAPDTLKIESQKRLGALREVARKVPRELPSSAMIADVIRTIDSEAVRGVMPKLKLLILCSKYSSRSVLK